MTVYFTSDLHFGHKNIMNFGRSQYFSDLDHMRESILANINSVVGLDDELYILGDVVMGVRTDNLPHLNRILARKVLVAGNHDYVHPVNAEKFTTRYDPIYREYFDEVHPGGIVDYNIDGIDVVLSHFPMFGDSTDKERYEEHRPVTDKPVIHGHIHSESISEFPGHIHIGIDADYTEYGVERFHPIPLEVIEELVRRA